MAVTKDISYGKLTIKELSAGGDEITENLAYVKYNLADENPAKAAVVAEIANNIADFTDRLVTQLTTNSLKSRTVSYEVTISGTPD